MSKELTKEYVILHKKSSIKTLNKMLEFYINSDNPKHLKKANLLSYWLESFSNYILNEENYSPLKQISYKRGNVLKVNFGFNVGKEYGGLHYAIVIDKKNDHHSHVVTVIPLTSGTENETHKKDVYLGTELFSKLYNRHSLVLDKSQKEMAELESINSSINETVTLITKMLSSELAESDNEIQLSTELTNKLHLFIEKKNEQENKIKQAQDDIEFIKKSQHELDKIKEGSIALIGQITTIDKARIYTPRKSVDVLYKISFSEEKMNLINEAIKNQYIF